MIYHNLHLMSQFVIGLLILSVVFRSRFFLTNKTYHQAFMSLFVSLRREAFLRNVSFSSTVNVSAVPKPFSLFIIVFSCFSCEQSDGVIQIKHCCVPLFLLAYFYNKRAVNSRFNCSNCYECVSKTVCSLQKHKEYWQ